jgi:thiol-disulfide isomerase/thioredoxin
LRAPVDTIAAPPFLTHLKWVNVATLRMDKQLGNPVLVEFWDCCRPNSLRTLPYTKAWHERYASDGLRVVGIHSPGFDVAADKPAIAAATKRLGVEYPVLIDPDLEMWDVYENQGWPARYLFDAHGMLAHYHYGEGAYGETELAIQELLGVERELLAPIRREDAPGAQLLAPSVQRAGAYSGPYEAGAVWAVLDGAGVDGAGIDGAGVDGAGIDGAGVDGAGVVQVNGGPSAGGREIAVTHPGAYALIEHERHTAGALDLRLGAGVRCLATCFTPGVA